MTSQFYGGSLRNYLFVNLLMFFTSILVVLKKCAPGSLHGGGWVGREGVGVGVGRSHTISASYGGCLGDRLVYYILFFDLCDFFSQYNLVLCFP